VCPEVRRDKETQEIYNQWNGNWSEKEALNLKEVVKRGREG